MSKYKTSKMKNCKKSQMKILQLKNRKTDIKFFLEDVNSKFEQAGKKESVNLKICHWRFSTVKNRKKK